MDAEGDRNFEAGQKFQTAAELILSEQNKNVKSNQISGNFQDSTFTNSGVSVYESVFNAAVGPIRSVQNVELIKVF